MNFKILSVGIVLMMLGIAGLYKYPDFNIWVVFLIIFGWFTMLSSVLGMFDKINRKPKEGKTK